MSWRNSQNSDLVVNNLTVNGTTNIKAEIAEDIELNTIQISGYIQNTGTDTYGNTYDAVISFQNANEITYSANEHKFDGDIYLGDADTQFINFLGIANTDLNMNNHQLLNIKGMSGISEIVQINNGFGLRVNGSSNLFGDSSGGVPNYTKTQGAYINWNSQSGYGTFDLINNHGGGGGGFRFYNQDTSGTIDNKGYYAQFDASGALQLKNTSDAASNKTGSFYTAGGVGIGKSIFAGSDSSGNATTTLTQAGILTLKNTTDSTYTVDSSGNWIISNPGALDIIGGTTIAKNLTVLGAVNIKGGIYANNFYTNVLMTSYNIVNNTGGAKSFNGSELFDNVGKNDYYVFVSVRNNADTNVSNVIQTPVIYKNDYDSFKWYIHTSGDVSIYLDFNIVINKTEYPFPPKTT